MHDKTRGAIGFVLIFSLNAVNQILLLFFQV
jgi:hypothetical protein